jgi:hypothetical protein
MPDYNNGEPWWIFTQLDGSPVMQFPATGSAFAEIYTNSKWSGLLLDEKLLDPAGIVKARLEKNRETQSVLEHFHKAVRDAVANQNSIIDLYHDRTYVAYGDGALGSPPTADAATGGNDKQKPTTEKGEARDALLTWGRVIWKGNVASDVTEEELRSATLLSDLHTGTVRVYLESRKQAIQFEVQKVSRLPASSHLSDPAPYDSPNGIIAGDVTAPVWSAEAQARGLDPRVKGDAAKGVQMAFVQHGYNHQFSYNHPWTRWAVLYSIVQLAQDASAPSC